MHYSVMLSEVIDNLNINENGTYVDATLGYAGHSSEIMKRLKRGFLFAFDQDKEAIIYSDKKLSEISLNYEIIHSNFKNLGEELSKRNINEVDGIIFDLGLSSPQIDNAERGFTFMNNAKLDMRMNQEQKFSAYDVVNSYSKNDLSKIFYEYGEEKLSNIIADKIIKYREKKAINTTDELVEIIKSATGANYFFKNHPERQIFQAIRIEVNNELNVLRDVLPDAIMKLKKGGRIAVITFHSLEDRIVKQIFKKYSEVDPIFKGLPDIPLEYQPKIKLINKKPILPTNEELEINSRSRSAKLRIVERI